VVTFVARDLEDYDKQTKQINELAAEGWEYVGLLSAASYGRLGSLGQVLFKRPKR
jgi:hypothetical protein